MRVLILLLLSAFLIGCSSTPEVIKLQPPAELLQNTDPPSRPGVTYRDMLLWLSAHMEALDQCNADKAGLRMFYEGELNGHGATE